MLKQYLGCYQASNSHFSPPSVSAPCSSLLGVLRIQQTINPATTYCSREQLASASPTVHSACPRTPAIWLHPISFLWISPSVLKVIIWKRKQDSSSSSQDEKEQQRVSKNCCGLYNRWSSIFTDLQWEGSKLVSFLVNSPWHLLTCMNFISPFKGKKKKEQERDTKSFKAVKPNEIRSLLPKLGVGIPVPSKQVWLHWEVYLQ